eukprot:6196014-Pleurochrysis_carterae.AAC.4
MLTEKATIPPAAPLKQVEDCTWWHDYTQAAAIRSLLHSIEKQNRRLLNELMLSLREEGQAPS